MKIYAISDLHLPSERKKSQDIFGDHWKGHPQKIKENWLSKINSDDIILLPGDISWATKWREAEKDLNYLSSLPGKKIIVEGNHDFWLSNKRNTKKEWLKDLDTDLSQIRLIYNDAIHMKVNSTKIGIAGTKGWSHRVSDQESDEKQINRQLIRLKQSLDNIDDDIDDLIIMMHYPPSNRILNRLTSDQIFEFERFDGRFWEIILQYSPSTFIFGHLHAIEIQTKQVIDGINVYCVSADLIDFNPVRIM